MTDKKIIKALECCSSPSKELKCHNCIAHIDGRCTMRPMHALDLIRRQQAKIEALKMDNEQLESDISNALMNADHMTELYNNAIKEFAKRLKKEVVFINTTRELIKTINNLVKEMTESEGEE